MCFYKGHYGFQDIDNIQVSRMFLKHSVHALKVGSWGFEGTIIFMILFSKLLESTFYKEISKFQQNV